MGDHDSIETVEEDDGTVVVCRCGNRSWGFWRGEAEHRHHLHFNAETIGKPGVETAREALRGTGEDVA